jgi:hypothetical protein
MDRRIVYRKRQDIINTHEAHDIHARMHRARLFCRQRDRDSESYSGVSGNLMVRVKLFAFSRSKDFLDGII